MCENLCSASRFSPDKRSKSSLSTLTTTFQPLLTKAAVEDCVYVLCVSVCVSVCVTDCSPEGKYNCMQTIAKTSSSLEQFTSSGSGQHTYRTATISILVPT